MKNLFKLLLLLLVLTTTSTVLVACDGEDGKDGIDGTNGQDGQDGEDGADYSVEDLIPLESSRTPNFYKVDPAFSSIVVTPILSSEDVLESSPEFVYGSLADGAGLLAEDDGTFTLLNNIEGDYSIARIKLNKDLKPMHGEYILNAFATAYTAQCSGSMITPEEHGFGPLYLSGGEWGGSSKGVFATNPYKTADNADTAIMLPKLGQWSTENAVVIGKDAYPDDTVAFIGDDHSDNSVPSGQLGMYVGSRGNFDDGQLYGLKVTTAGIDFEMDMAEGVEYDAEFVELNETQIDLLDAEAKAKGVMGFSRLEDIDWRRGSAANQREIYFCVTGRDKADLVGKGSLLGRIYKVVLNEKDPTGAAKITCVLDGDIVGGKADGFHSPDNILVTENYAYIQEDPNGYAYLNSNISGYAKMYQYNLNSGDLKTVLECDQDAAAAAGYGTTSNYWEITGMIDVTDIVDNGENTFIIINQNHGWEPADGSSFTDPKANSSDSATKEGSTLFTITGLER
ncbi:phosphatase [Tamlana sp. s12]|uniref:alkaline phosphatase PhoX n=1 Tax=Tamlana sp. s12 TaxID=1630406 RepID=UPI0007FE0275|nr:alkaline phosphatase PhoX [Tamlana sp. s12]OBQ56426.1 phosphatase [Tamlana sp. s12]QQY81949.1 phosphatase [Tamlana sp. s12]